MAVQSLLLRCLPGIVRAGPLRTAGLVPAPSSLAQRMLGRHSGTVWVHPAEQGNGDAILIHLEDVDVCRVVAPTIDPKTLLPFVTDVFRAGLPDFRKEVYLPGENGAFRAIYQASSSTVGVRVSAKRRRDNGAGYAIFTVIESLR